MRDTVPGGGQGSGAAAAGPAHARPTTQRRAQPADTAASRQAALVAAAREERLRSAACSSALWRRSVSQTLVEVPLCFPGGVDEYVRAFEPLLFEEAREEVRTEWAKACESRKLFKVRLGPLKSEGENVYSVMLLPEDEALLQEAGRALPEGGVAVLSLHEPSKEPWKELESQATADDAANARTERARAAAAREREEGEVDPVLVAAPPSQPSRKPALHVAGVIVRVNPTRRHEAPELILRFNLSPVMEDEPASASGEGHLPRPMPLFFQPQQVLAALQHGGDGRHVWHLAAVGRLSSAIGQFNALHRVRFLPPHILRPLLNPPPPARAANAAAVLALDQSPDYNVHTPPPLHQGLAMRPFMNHLHTAFNDPQRRAIHWAGSAAMGNEGQWPFTLVQGPPGTGKTTTVWGMLNVLHLTAYQRYYVQLTAALAPQSAAAQAAVEVQTAQRTAAQEARALYGDASDSDEEPGRGASGAEEGEVAGASLDAALARAGAGRDGHTRELSGIAQKPRILVCCPSNAAVDSLLKKVLERGFIQADGQVYQPDVVRLAADDAELDPGIQCMAVGAKIRQLLEMSGQERVSLMGRYELEVHATKQHILQMSRRSEQIVRTLAAGGPEAEDLAPDAQARILAELGRASELLDRKLVQLGRLLLVEQELRTPAGQSVLRPSRGGERRGASPRLRNDLEDSFVNEAELVFTTLASAGRSVFARLKHGFEIVLIDEAAQASELESLVPLAYGAKSLVMVGDPQQLPATVLSAAARGGKLCRSLFERLSQSGVDSLLLSIQYRMHPAIRQWPGQHFYGSRLRDGDSVLAMQPEPFYADPLLQPYLFFDVSGGREQRGAGGSVANMAEAQLAAALYLRLKLALADRSIRGRVCIITPYKRQLKALQDALVCRCGPAVGNEVRVSTIDSFQGQEADVIILSLVRAAAPPPPAADGGPNPASLRVSLGFVTDVRRMNVALTRARRALWVLGSASSLAASPEWSALLSDAHERGLVVQNSTAAALFPEHAARMTAEALTWESRSQAAGGRGPAVAGRGALPGLGPAMAMDSTGLGFAPPLRPAAPPMRQVLSGLTVHHTDRPPPVPIPARAAAGMEATQALNTVRRDLRSIEEVQEEIAAKRQRRDMGPPR